jgi:hypothetical protein
VKTTLRPSGEKIGKVDDLFVDENDQPEYIGVKMGFLGARFTLIPRVLVNGIEEAGVRIVVCKVVSVEKTKAKDGATFDDDREITPKFEIEVHSYYDLRRAFTTGESGAYYAEGTTETTGVADVPT